MTLKKMICVFILLALALFAAPALSTSACDPSDTTNPGCIPTPTPRQTVTSSDAQLKDVQSRAALAVTKLLSPPWLSDVLDQSWSRILTTRLPAPKRTPAPASAPVAPKATPVPAAAPAAPVAQGTGPSDAMDANYTWHTIAPHSRVWYKIGGGPQRQRIEAWLDAEGAEGIGFDVYAPDNMPGWTPSTLPKGRGTRNRNDKSHDLNWGGQAPMGGTWYVVVTNSTGAPIRYRLGSSRVEGGRTNCTGPYWEYFLGAERLWPGYCYD